MPKVHQRGPMPGIPPQVQLVYTLDCHDCNNDRIFHDIAIRNLHVLWFYYYNRAAFGPSR